MDATDHELLRRYTRDGSQAAFAEIVRRHLNLVYSAAQRQVRSAALAEDVAQSVFFDLSRNAARLKPGTPLVAWLHLVTRRTAIDAIRRESRRQAREQAALEISAMKPSPSVWAELEPLLDSALEKLPEVDRTAVLLRFFENKSLREVGAALGSSEEAAQKRVTRAIDRLRTILARSGVTIGAASLASELSAHAIQSAPLALGTTITAAAGNAAVQATVLHATQTFAMTTLQKSAVAVVLALAFGGVIYESTALGQSRAEAGQFRKRIAALETDLRQARDQRGTASAQLASTERQIDSRMAELGARVSSGDVALQETMETWLANLQQLKLAFQRQPSQAIPEMQLLTDDQWFEIASQTDLKSEAGMRTALGRVRQRAENLLGNKLQRALSDYLQAHEGTLPDRIDQLLPFLGETIPAFWLDRYEMLETGQLSAVPEKNRFALLGTKAPVDIEYDTLWKMGVSSWVNQRALNVDIDGAQKAFAAANGGQKAEAASQLRPYLRWPAPDAAVDKFLAARRPGARTGN